MISESSGLNKKSSDSITVRENQVDFQQDAAFKQVFNLLKKDFVWSSSLIEQTNFCSDNISSVIGYTAEEIKSFNEKRLALTIKDDIARIREALNEFLTDSSINVIKLHYKLETKNHTHISVVEKIYTIRDENGEATSLYGIVSDISDAKEAEDRLYDTISELQKINEAKDKFVARISHDLRSPFTSIIGFAEVLLSDPKIPEKEKSEYLNFILQSSRNLLHFVNQLSEIIKLQTFRTKLEPQRTNVNRLVHYSVASFTSQIVDKNLQVNVNINESLHITVDERLFLVLIAGLVSNAVKFSRIGGKITISAQQFNDEFMEIIVKDDGVGISEKNKIKLFKIDQIFFAEGTKGEKGVGLGLLLAKEIVEKHGGNLWFYSNQNEGSEFHFTLPISKNTVLIVEKDSSVLNSYEELLKSNFHQFEVICAHDGYDALTQIADRVPIIVILTHELPLMSGLQLLESIIKSNKNSKIFILLCADELSEEIIKAYEKFGLTEILNKPVSLKVLGKKIRELVDTKL